MERVCAIYLAIVEFRILIVGENEFKFLIRDKDCILATNKRYLKDKRIGL